MKSIYLLFFLLLSTISTVFTDPNITLSSPSLQSNVNYDETPSLIKEKTQSQLNLPPQLQLSQNIQTQSIILGPATHRIDHGFDLDNIDPYLEIVKAPQPQTRPINTNIDDQKDLNNLKISPENNVQLNKTHALSFILFLLNL